MPAIYRDNEIIGHVYEGGCENQACIAASDNGRPFHATPMGFAVTLNPNHFATSEEAVKALRVVMDGVPGRKVTERRVAPRRVRVHRTNNLFGAVAGREAFVRREYWRNGEGWYSLEDAETGEVFETPDVFWTEVRS